MKRVTVAGTFKLTWVNSGVTTTGLVATILDGSETVVSTHSAVSSGNGHYYANVSVNTPGFYSGRFDGTISGEPYRRYLRFKAVTGEVD